MPPSLTVTRRDVAPASKQFSSSSLRADAGRCMILKAAREAIVRGARAGRREVIISLERNGHYLACGNAVDDCILQPADWLWLWLAFDRGFRVYGLCALHTVCNASDGARETRSRYFDATRRGKRLRAGHARDPWFTRAKQVCHAS